jgi:hypothetical protein
METGAVASHGLDRLVVASAGGWKSVSTRDRLRPLAERGPWPVDALSAAPFPGTREIDTLVSAGGDQAVLILQRVLPRPEEMVRLRRAYHRIVFDIDDAIYATPPQVGQSALVAGLKAARRLVLRGGTTRSSRRRPLERVLRDVDVCVTGNSILASFARRFAPQVVEVPTTVEPIDLPPSHRPELATLVWLGLPDNLQYLDLIRAPLEQLGREADVCLRIISTATWHASPLPVEFVRYSESAARSALLSASAGISPLTDDPWTRGKCAMRAIQYGGHALPAVASPVGITDRVILDGDTGYLPRSDGEWLAALRRLVLDPHGAAEMGKRALEHIRRYYSNDVSVQRWVEILRAL